MHFKVYSKYFYSRLDEDSKNAYRQILQAWLDYRKEISIDGLNGKVDFSSIVDNILDDIPELFYVDLNQTSIAYYTDHTVINTDFKYSAEEIERYKREMMEAVNRITLLCADKTDKEQFLHDYLVKNVTYTKGESRVDSHNIIGPLLKKDAVCEGISKAFKLLCDAVGIPCILIYGEATTSDSKTEGHAWNIVRRNGLTYHVDVTWDGNLNAAADKAPYYNVSDEFIGKNHTWEQNKWPVCSTKGEIEGRIIDVFGLKSLAHTISTMCSQRTNNYILRFNKKFVSTEEVMDVIRQTIYKHNIGISSLATSYCPKLDCAFIEVAYR